MHTCLLPFNQVLVEHMCHDKQKRVKKQVHSLSNPREYNIPHEIVILWDIVEYLWGYFHGKRVERWQVPGVLPDPARPGRTRNEGHLRTIPRSPATGPHDGILVVNIPRIVSGL